MAEVKEDEIESKDEEEQKANAPESGEEKDDEPKKVIDDKYFSAIKFKDLNLSE